MPEASRKRYIHSKQPQQRQAASQTARFAHWEQTTIHSAFGNILKWTLTTLPHGAMAVQRILQTVKCFVRLTTGLKEINNLCVCRTMRQAFFFVACPAHCRLLSIIFQYPFADLSDKLQVTVLKDYKKTQYSKISKAKPRIWYQNQIQGCLDILLFKSYANASVLQFS